MSTPPSITTPLRYLLAALSGGLAVLAFPPVSWLPAALVAWPLLFLALRGAGARTGTRLGVVHGFVLYAVGLSWLAGIFGAVAFALWMVLALFTGAAGGFIGGATARYPRAWWLALYAACVWSGLEYFRCEWFWLRFPWMTPGLAFGPTFLSPLVGVYGAGFVIVLMAGVLAFVRGRWRWAAVVPLLVLASPFPAPVYEPGVKVPVLAVQGEHLVFNRYVEQTLSGGVSGGVLVWPEHAVDDLLQDGTKMAGAMQLAGSLDSVLVTGAARALPGDHHYNAAITLDQTGQLGWHGKNRPVTLFADGHPGPTAEPVRTRYGMIGTPVCFDCDFTEITRRMTAAGAQAFLVPSMDEMSWGARQHLQHAELVRHRAAENGRWFAVASSSGLTQIVDPRGRRVRELPLMADGTLAGEIRLRDGLTFFTRWGWWLPWILLAAAVVWTVALLITARAGRSAR